MILLDYSNNWGESRNRASPHTGRRPAGGYASRCSSHQRDRPSTQGGCAEGLSSQVVSRCPDAFHNLNSQ